MSDRHTVSCDRCPMVESREWVRPDGARLRMCQLHEDKHWVRLTAAGFAPADASLIVSG